MTKKKKIISVAHGTVERIATELRVSRSSVFNALAYRSESDSAKLIREKALKEYGGIETTKIIF